MPDATTLPEPPQRRQVIFGQPGGLRVENTRTTIPLTSSTVVTRSDVVVPLGPQNQLNVDLSGIAIRSGGVTLGPGTVSVRPALSSQLSTAVTPRSPATPRLLRLFPGFDPLP